MAQQAQRTCEDCGCKFLAGPWARWCPVHRPLHRGRKVKYKLTDQIARLIRDRYDSKVPGRAAEIGAEIGWPKWQVQKAAARLGVAHPWPPDRRAWTDDQVEYLQTWAGLRSPKWIGRQLGRRESSVMNKLKHLRLSWRVRGGYSQRALAACFGCDDHLVGRWIKRGLLEANMQGTLRRHDIRRVSEPAILEFIRLHREEYRLDKVDQKWFLDLVLGPGGQNDNRRREGGRPDYAPTARQIDQRAAEIQAGWHDENGVLRVEPEEENAERRMQDDECRAVLTVTADP